MRVHQRHFHTAFRETIETGGETLTHQIKSPKNIHSIATDLSMACTHHVLEAQKSDVTLLKIFEIQTI